jgi:alkylation response protein AidB-like acyl-CoA dehydrogenase
LLHPHRVDSHELQSELILAHGPADQKARFLPGVASGALIPTATANGTKSRSGRSTAPNRQVVPMYDVVTDR